MYYDNVWCDNGMTTRNTCECEGNFDAFSFKKLLKCTMKRLLLVVSVGMEKLEAKVDKGGKKRETR